MKQNNDLTIENIGLLLDKKIGEFRLESNNNFRAVNKRLDEIDEKTEGRFHGIEDRLDAQSDRVRKLERAMVSLRNVTYQKVDALKTEINDRFEDIDTRFYEVLDKIQEFIGVTDKSEDKKIKDLKNLLEPRIEKIEHEFRFSTP